jgi:cell wall-associated NlpC family hydrolase
MHCKQNLLKWILLGCLFTINITLLSSCHSKKVIVTTTNKNTSYKTTTNKTTDKIIAFTKTLIGTPYKYAGNSPSTGFDCSGFVHYVFAHFNITMPRVSKQFEALSTNIPLQKVQPCDIILFAGQDGNTNNISHVGIIISGINNDIQFIHASTSKGVMISGMNTYFAPRLVKVVRVL